MTRPRTLSAGRAVAVTASSAAIALVPGGRSVTIANLGAVAVHARLGAAGVAATTADAAIPPAGRLELPIAPRLETHLALIGAGAGPSAVIVSHGGGADNAPAPPASAIAAPIGTRSYLPNSISDGIVTSGTSRWKTRIYRDQLAQGLRLLFVNWYADTGGTTEIAGANAITVAASAEIGGVKIPLLWGDGTLQATLQPGAQAWAYLLPTDLGNAAHYVFFNVYVSVASAGMTWPQTDTPQTRSDLAEGNSYGAPGTDLTPAGSAAVGAASAAAYGPIAITGFAPGGVRPRSVALLGDSITRGTGDTTGDADGNTGWAARWLNHRVPYLNLSKGGERANYLQIVTRRARRMAVLGAVKPESVILNLARNDLAAGRTALQLRSDLIDLGQAVLQLGIRPWLVTCTPDSAFVAEEAERLAHNAWARSAPAPFAGCIEVADLVETARDSGTWLPGYTGDGTHPNATAAAAIAAGLADPADTFGAL